MNSRMFFIACEIVFLGWSILMLKYSSSEKAKKFSLLGYCPGFLILGGETFFSKSPVTLVSLSSLILSLSLDSSKSRNVQLKFSFFSSPFLFFEFHKSFPILISNFVVDLILWHAICFFFESKKVSIIQSVCFLSIFARIFLLSL